MLFCSFINSRCILNSTPKIELSEPVILSEAKDLKILHFVQNDIMQRDFYFSVGATIAA